MEDYLEPIPPSPKQVDQAEGKEDEQKTPKRIVIKYQTTGVFEDISNNTEEDSNEDMPR